jgi:hypothetical protein
MTKFGLATILTAGVAAAILGFAAPAQATIVAEPVDVASAGNHPAGVDHQAWLDQIGPHAVVPQVDTSAHQSR